MLDSAHAPGCYGSAFIYAAGAPECQSCIFRDSCGPEARARRARIFEAHGVEDPELVRKPVRLNDQAAALFATIDGDAALDALRQGRNPFRETRFLAVVAHLLIKVEAPITRDTLKAALMRALAMAKTPAETHVRTAIQVLEAIGAVRIVEGKVRRAW